MTITQTMVYEPTRVSHHPLTSNTEVQAPSGNSVQPYYIQHSTHIRYRFYQEQPLLRDSTKTVQQRSPALTFLISLHRMPLLRAITLVGFISSISKTVLIFAIGFRCRRRRDPFFANLRGPLNSAAQT